MNKNVFVIIRIILAAALCVSCAMPKSEQGLRQSYDPDLHGWKTASWSPFTVTDSIGGFAYGNGRYVAVSRSTTGIIAWSLDGDVWHRANISPDTVNGLNAVAYGNGMFVAVGNGGMFAWSENGEDWTGSSETMTGFGTEDICGIAWGAGFFVAVGGNANISVSAGGINWVGCRDSAFGDIRLNDIAFDSGRFYVVGNGGNRGWADASELNGDWHRRGPEDPFGGTDITGVVVGRYGSASGIGVVFGNRAAIATRDDFSGFDANLEAFLLQGNRLNRIAWGGGYFVVAGTSAMIGHWNSAEPSNNGTRIWTALSFSEFKRWEITSLAACNGRFFIGNIGGKIGYSK